ncbi:MAG: hypothetical protein R3326_08855 [Gemmatimonadota bacterium]|nr:hypothetical protein [Gemmatimonadota bacterium]
MIVVTVSGTASEVGKTTLVCQLLERLPGWGAVKVTRGHYRSCGRDPETCCVSHLLADEPRVFSEAADVDVEGKDTGRYVAAGAAAVRWVVCRRGQEREGIARALADLDGLPGVIVEGNAVVAACDPALSIMVAPPDAPEVKSSAVRILDRVDAIYVPDTAAARAAADDPAPLVGAPAGSRRWPVWGRADLDRVVAAAEAGGIVAARSGA